MGNITGEIVKLLIVIALAPVVIAAVVHLICALFPVLLVVFAMMGTVAGIAAAIIIQRRTRRPSSPQEPSPPGVEPIRRPRAPGRGEGGIV